MKLESGVCENMLVRYEPKILGYVGIEDVRVRYECKTRVYDFDVC